MPDDNGQWAQLRGARPVTIRARLGGDERMSRHAAYRLPMDHPEMARLDQLHAGQHLTARQYANACAVMRLYEASGLGRSKGVAGYLRTDLGRASGEAYGPEDEMRDLISRGGVGMQAVLMLIRGEAVLPYMWGRCTAHLDTLDHVAARWDGECWSAE